MESDGELTALLSHIIIGVLKSLLLMGRVLLVQIIQKLVLKNVMLDAAVSDATKCFKDCANEKDKTV